MAFSDSVQHVITVDNVWSFLTVYNMWLQWTICKSVLAVYNMWLQWTMCGVFWQCTACDYSGQCVRVFWQCTTCDYNGRFVEQVLLYLFSNIGKNILTRTARFILQFWLILKKYLLIWRWFCIKELIFISFK